MLHWQITGKDYRDNNSRGAAGRYETLSDPSYIKTRYQGSFLQEPFIDTRLYNPDNNQWIGYQDLQGKPYTGNAALFQYDAHGNPTIYKGNTLTFDADDHMTAYGTQMQAGYTGDGLRAWKSSTANGTVYFVYDGDDLLAETTANGNVTCYNTWGDGDLVSRTNVNPNTNISTSTFYQFDSEGNVLQHLDSSDNVLITTAYDAWGNVIGGTAPSDPYGYKGEFGYYTDSETGLILCMHRYYDPKAGRWLNEDPIGICGGMNIYGYCCENPINSYDRNGYSNMILIFSGDTSGGAWEVSDTLDE